jgi:hypothetical protein
VPLGKVPQATAAAEGEGGIDHPNGSLLSGDKTADMGVDETIPRADDYNERNNQFTDQIDNVTVELKGCCIASSDAASPT